MSNKWIKLLPALCLMWGCNKGGDVEYLDNPKPGGEKSARHVSIAYLKSLYERAPVAIDDELYITGCVSSSDQYGAFYRNLVLEDQTGGIVLRVDLENYHRIFYQYHEIYVACNSLILSNYGGVVQLGSKEGAILPERLEAMVDVRSAAELAPLPLTFETLAPEHISRFVSFDNVQFEEENVAWCAPENIEAGTGTDRWLVDRAGNRLLVRTSPFVSFARRTLPAGSGYIEGILGVFNGEYQLEVCSDLYAVMESPRF